MRKILVVAKSEFLTAVRSKGFIVGVLLMPILMGVSIVVQTFSAKHIDVNDRYFAVIDGTGELYEVLTKNAIARNTAIDQAVADAEPMAKFMPTRVTEASSQPADEVRLKLSEQIKRNELFAFVEIPAGILATDAKVDDKIVYYSDKPTYEDLNRWVAHIVNQEILTRRFAAAGLTMEQYKSLSKPVESEHRGLTTRTATGEIQTAIEVDKIQTFVIPIVLMFLLFMVVMAAVPQLLNSAIEEKMTRVSEMLLGSVTPFELMMGKLLASTGVSGVLAALYLGGGFAVAANAGRADAMPISLFLYFVLFMLLAVMFYGSVFIAIGAACSELKDAQAMMTPAMLILLLPLFVWHPVLTHPDSTLAVVASLFPPATPMLMLMRLSSHPPPPAWQVILGIVLTSVSTLLCVWAAGKVFRIGILSQGKTPSFRELIRWVTRP